MARGFLRRRRRVFPFSGGDSAEAVIEALEPAGWWKFDEGSGDVANDSIGSNDFNLTGVGVWTSGGFQTTISTATSAGNSGVVGANAKTVVMVARTDTGSDAGEVGIRFVGAGNTWGLRNSGTSPSAVVRIYSGATTNNTALNLGAAGTWHFLAAANTGSNLNTTTVYLDGSSAAATASVVMDHTGVLDVGHNNSEVVAQITGYVLVWTRALNSTEIADVRTALTTIMAARGVTLP